MKDKIAITLTVAIFLLVSAGVYINVKQQQALDRSKIPPKVELSRGFQRWITNLKNKGIIIEADNFRLKEENEIYNSKWTKVYSMDDPQMKMTFEDTIKSLSGVGKVIFSPSGREFVDYRNQIRGAYQPNEVRFYGQKEDKIIDARILNCDIKANCYFDRAFFLDNDVFVVTEVSRNVDKKDTNVAACSVDAQCTYTFKVHVIDLIKNSRLVYESKPFDVVLTKLIPEL